MRFNTALIIAAAALAPASLCLADIPGGDVYLSIANGRIHTGLISEDGTTITPGVRVFYGELGLDVPNFAEDPGFQGPPGTFDPASTTGFNFTGALHKWTGADFSLIPSETMTLALGGQSVTTPGTDADAPGFDIAVSADGEWHHHPGYTLNDPASDGIYLLQLNFHNNAAGVADSLPIWMLWNQNSDLDTAQAAYDYAAANIPAPGATALLIITAIAGARRRR